MVSRSRSVLFVLAAVALLGVPADVAATTPTPTITPTPSPTPTPTPSLPQELTPVSVTASTNDGNVPANTIDSNLATRWAGFGEGAWIQYDLGSPRTLTHVGIAVYRGNERRNLFDLETSSDGTTWSPLLTSAQTSGTTTAEQTHEFPDRPNVRFVRYVGHGSTVGLWNSLTEVSLFSARTAPWCSVTPSTTLAAVGETVLVRANSNLGLGVWGLSVVDSATGQLQDEANPIFTPARPPQQNGNFTVSWTLVAARPGTVTFRVGVHGEIRDDSCGCFYFTHASGSSVPVTVQDGTITPTPTPTATNTPTPTPPVPVSGYYRIMARHSGKAVVVQNASTANGANVFQWTYGGTQTNDEWHLQNTIAGLPVYRVTNRHSGKVMEVAGASTANGGNVAQNGWTTQNHQMWQVDGLGNGYYRLVVRHSGKVLNVSGAGTTNGTNVDQWSWTGGTHQQFQLIAVP
jgi:hypothetical protein